MGKCTKYLITAKENYGGRRVIHSYDTKPKAERQLKKILSPGKVRKGTGYMKGKKIYLTSYRDSQSGTGINNPRIKKIRGHC
ncbi:MAG: hypothetical protein KKF48_02420 [Nanoarchaeota archaeon]|nr:hypothetical protein [Nanoarchaeota archaeon]MBU1027875.1 hypothetical protein [Nanoarchaeota archaeon]